MKLITPKLLTWYREYHRDLPWRKTLNPYYIWISEMILQQTRVEQGLPYYLRFLDKFPKITDLANAQEAEVLEVWQGLGYYARARNLHKTAQYIVQNCAGHFPDTYSELLKLKGIGPYTAAAIASFAFKIPVPVVDGNVKRVSARYFGLSDNTETPAFFKMTFALLEDAIPPASPDIFNQAMMELGATVCTPANPKCPICPLRETCVAFAENRTSELPVRKKKIKVITRYVHFCAFEFENQYILRQRPSEGIWGGLFEYPHFDSSGEIDSAFPIAECPWAMPLQIPVLTVKTLHKLSHQHIHAYLWKIPLTEKPQTLSSLGTWLEFEELKSFPLHKLMRKFVSL